MKLTLPIPDYSTVCRRQRGLSVRLGFTSCPRPRHVVIDATGLRVYGAGEWRVSKYRVCRRRTWRKLHLGVDESTREIVAVELTESRVHDSQPLPAVLDQIPGPIEQVAGDGAYDTRACYEAVLQRGATPVFHPGAQQNYTTPWNLAGGVLHETISFSRLPSTDARHGGYSVGTRVRVSRRIRCIGSRGYSGGTFGRGAWQPNVSKR
jgi:hypothetical protein